MGHSYYYNPDFSLQMNQAIGVLLVGIKLYIIYFMHRGACKLLCKYDCDNYSDDD